VVTLSGFSSAVYLFKIEKFKSFTQSWFYSNPDTPFSVFKQAVMGMPFITFSSNLVNSLAVILILAGLTVAFVFFLYSVEESLPRFKQCLPHLFIAFLILNILLSSAVTSSALLRILPQEPVDESYAFDAFIYLKTFYKMAKGVDYYHALPEAAIADARVDKVESWLSGYSLFRLPTVFYLWRIFAGNNGSNIFYLSLLLVIGAILLTFYAIRGIAGDIIATFSSVLVAVYLYVGATWLNILFPDWWGALFGFLALSFFFMKKYPFAAGFALLGALSREAMGLLIVAGLLAGIFTKRQEIWSWFGIAFTLFLSIYGIHQYLVRMNITLKGTGLANFYKWQITSLYVTTNYLNFPLTFLGLQSVVLPFAAIVSIFNHKEWANRIIVFIFLSSFILYLLAMRTSSYWGQMFMPIVLILIPFILQPYLYEGEREVIT
jgi:hypothetical protein